MFFMKRPLLLPLRRQSHLLFLLLLIVSPGLYAQQKVQIQALETPFLYQPGQELLPEKATSAETADQTQAGQIIRCWTMESDTILRQQHPEMGSLDDFEAWMSRAKQEYLNNYNPSRDPIVTIPIIFHVIHNGENTGTGSNLNAIYIQAQIDQLNDDFRRLGAGFNTNPVGADIEVEFCAAILDPSGNLLAEPGINRINRNTAGFNTPPYSDTYIDNTVKPATQWDPTQYFNVWVANISGGLLGWAQFPSSSGLADMPANGGAANTDGVVVLYTSVGSIATPHPNGGIYAAGRTLSHETGHFFGLRHIWGDDAVCNATNDYCGDTPDHSGANLNCPTGESSCGIPEMPENYMDYTQDNCMNIFTADQKLRMRTVLALSPRRASLTTSNRCTPPGPYI
ncbi:MAG: zinc metalloprotease, partial [Bacteroidetes bacterium]